MRTRWFNCACAKINPFDASVLSYGVANSLQGRFLIESMDTEKKVPFRLVGFLGREADFSGRKANFLSEKLF